MRRTGMSTGTRRWLIPLVAALAVLAVIAVMWQQRPGASDEVGAGSDGGGGAPPYAGVEPGSPGQGDDLTPQPVEPPGDGGGVDADYGTIAVDSFYRYDETRLALNYTNGIPECYGKAGTPLVEETADSVRVTVPRTPPTGDGDTACIDIALMASVDITLERPLGDRVVLDGSRDDAKVKEAASPHDPEQAQ